MKKQKGKKYPEGHFVGRWIGICMVISTGFGIPFSIISGNSGLIGIWPGMGLVVGLAIGQSLENKYKKEDKIRSLTKKEEKTKKLLVTVGVSILLLLALAAFLLLVLK